MNQMYTPPLTPTNKLILIVTAGVFLLQAVTGALGIINLSQLFSLSASDFSRGLVYQLVTYPFVESQLMNVLFNGLVFWFIGSDLELLWGKRVYTRFLIMITLLVGIIHLLLATLLFKGSSFYLSSLSGLTGLNFALLFAYAFTYPDRQMSFMMLFPMKAKAFCLLLAGIEGYFALFSSAYAAFSHLFAMGLSFLFIRYQNHLVVKSIFQKSLKREKKGKGHLYVVKSDKDEPPKYWQ